VPVSICNPAHIRYLGRSEGLLAKNDPLDAGLIERFANSKRPAAEPPLSRAQLALNEMATHRRQIVEAIKVMRTHRQQVSAEALVVEIDKTIAILEERLAVLDGQLREKIETQPAWKRTFEELTKTKGVGFRDRPHAAGENAGVGDAQPRPMCRLERVGSLR